MRKREGGVGDPVGLDPRNVEDFERWVLQSGSKDGRDEAVVTSRRPIDHEFAGSSVEYRPGVQVEESMGVEGEVSKRREGLKGELEVVALNPKFLFRRLDLNVPF